MSKLKRNDSQKTHSIEAYAVTCNCPVYGCSCGNCECAYTSNNYQGSTTKNQGERSVVVLDHNKSVGSYAYYLGNRGYTGDPGSIIYK